MQKIEHLTKKILGFRDERDWKQFHNPKDLAISLCLEAAEVLEHFQWKNDKEMKEYVQAGKDEIGEELADVLNCLILLSHELDIDLFESLDNKLVKNAKKYPASKSKGNHKKYTKL